MYLTVSLFNRLEISAAADSHDRWSGGAQVTRCWRVGSSGEACLRKGKTLPGSREEKYEKQLSEHQGERRRRKRVKRCFRPEDRVSWVWPGQG